MPVLIYLLWAVSVACFNVAGARSAWAQTTEAGPAGAFIAPFPENDTYRIQVWGDWMAEGLLSGLTDALSGDPRLQLVRRHRVFSGLLRGDPEDEAKSIEADLSREAPHIAVIVLSLSDRGTLRVAGQRLAMGSPAWKVEYARRVERVLRLFKRRNVAVYWVGHPIMRRNDASEDARAINEIVRERVFVGGQKFIDAYAGFRDEGGNYAAYGPDITGKNRLLRDQDSNAYTGVGYRKLAHFVERDLKRDVALARSERTIPLAGAEGEQKRIRPRPAPSVDGRRPDTASGEGSSAGAAQGAAQADPSLDRTTAEMGSPNELRADSSRITLKVKGQSREDTISLEILRPAIPAAVLSHITRRESPDKASQQGDLLMTEILGGVTVMNSVTAQSDGSGGERRRNSPTDTAYYRVLIKGERLPAREGRQDDLPWPRQEVLPEIKAEPAPALQPTPKAAPKAPQPRSPPSRG